jgi:putative flavoprotein involved in K+ transport
MHRVETLVVGAGQAGLAASRCLAEQGADHVVVERGRIAERWRTARWESLRLITPNWMSRLPVWCYSGTDPDGYMAAPELVSYLEGYAGSFAAPVHENTTVELVEASGGGLRVVTDNRTWLASNVIVATGTENRPYVPSFASGIDPGVHQLTASRYQGPHQVPDGGVLVVGASASGVQIADELRRSGRPVTISVGRHARLPRRYRGRDILWWMDQTGVLGQTIDQVRDTQSARQAPSLQLSGRGRRISLDALAADGVTLAGRLAAADGRRLSFADDLPATTGAAQAQMEQLLRSIDARITHSGEQECTSPADPPPPFTASAGPAALDLYRAGIATVIWATGYRPAYPWLRVPVLDRHGQIAHSRGVTIVPGLYVLGLRFLHRRDSSFIGGVGRDARLVAAHLTGRMASRALAAP